MENFSIECSKTKPKLLQRPIRQKENIFKSQRELKVETDQPVKAQENASDQVTIGFFCYVSDRLS